ncbi:MAG: hypothetical protein N4A37_09940 [Prolixibacteraceae bacterium]|jgi:anti-sigma regulatory factor (Ser/Thr protein kinase)|nr:hypothetical protein [Prolixibacteraceae bacterium]
MSDNSFYFNSVNHDLNGFNEIGRFYNFAKNLESVEINMYYFFSANLSSCLGAVIEKLKNFHQCTVNINFISKAKITLRKNNFLVKEFGFDPYPDTNRTTIRYEKIENDTLNNASLIIEKYLNRDEMPTMSTLLKDLFSDSVHELLTNVWEHSNNDTVYICGQQYPATNNSCLDLTISDSGQGIATKVRDFIKDINTDIDAVAWAMQNGNTTKNTSGGLGLSLLEEFIIKNEGTLQVVSGTAFYERKGEQLNKRQLNYYLPGTYINIIINTKDRKHYYLKSEKTKIKW